MSCKRQKLLLDVEPSPQVSAFNPILESITRFLRLGDCARVVKLNHSYYDKTWLYILQSSTRLYKLNDIVEVNDKSMTWISKYRSHLKYQKIQVSSNNVPFDLSTITQCLSLRVLSNISTFPVRVKHLIFSQYSGNEFPNIQGVKKVYISDYFNQSLVTTCPKTIKKLTIVSFYTLDGQELPILPKLKIFQCNIEHMVNMNLLEKKFPNLTTLHLFFSESLLQMKQFSYFKHRLIIESKSLITANMFSNFQCQELDLSGCPNIQDYSGVAHIRFVKRFEKNNKTSF
jgi:hypothetical protein